MNSISSSSPIFLHSLFRSGSTYLFKVFRRLGEGYTCYQEPLHEITVQARDNHGLLLGDQGGDKVRELRHPKLDKPYFSELYSLGPDCLEHLTESEVYDAYFAPSGAAAGLDFWRTLISESTGRPVIQECRTSGRVGIMREQLGGFHAFLWRNPWDQWWSYQVSSYFDLTSQLIFNASDRPRLVELVGEHIGFRPLANQSLKVTFDWFAHRPLSPDQAYQAFYTLWLLALHSARQEADLLVNIDSLSAYSEEQSRIRDGFDQAGVSGLDFSDCRIPVSWFSAEERQHFEALEETVHELWREAGMSADDLDALLRLRENHEPERNSKDVAAPAEIEGVSGELARYRDLVRRKEQELVGLHRDSDHQLQASHRREDDLRDKLAQQESREKAQAVIWRDKNAALKAELDRLQQSRSWRITAPLRELYVVSHRWREDGGRATARRILGERAIRLVFWGDRITQRFPRLRQALLSAVFRVPLLRDKLRKIHHRRHLLKRDNSVVRLHPRSREIYRELTAAMEEFRSGDRGGEV